MLLCIGDDCAMKSKIEELKEKLDLEADPEDKLEIAVQLADLLVDNSYFQDCLNLTAGYMAIAKQLNNLNHQKNLLKIQANSAFYLGDLEKAIESNLNLVNILFELDDKTDIAGTFNNVAGIYYSKKEPNKSLEYLKKGIEFLKNEVNKEPLIAIYTNMANLLINSQKYEEALKSAEEALKLAKKYNKDIYYSSIYMNLADIYFQNGNKEKCFSTIDKALDVARKTKDIYKIASATTSKAHFLHSTGKTEKAVEILLPMLKASEEQSYGLLHQKILQSLSQYYAHLKDFTKALECLKKKHVILQKISEKRIIEKTEELEAKFDSLISDKEKELYKVKNVDLQNAVTKLNEAYADLETTQQEKILTEKMNTVIATAVTANHQINQPLMIIQGNLDLIYSKIPDKDAVDDSYMDILNNINFIHRTLEEMDRLKSVKTREFTGKITLT